MKSLPCFFLAAAGVCAAPSIHAADVKKRVLIVEVTTGYRHASIPTGEKVINQLAEESGVFEVVGIVKQPEVKILLKPEAPKPADPAADDKTKAKYEAALKGYQEKLAVYDPVKAQASQDQFANELKANLEALSTASLAAKGIDGVIFDSTTGDLPLPDRQGFIDWIGAGHAFIGIHSATDTLHEFKPYIDMIGGEFDGHPWHQAVTVRVEDPSHPAAGKYRDKFEVDDEIYQFKNFRRENAQVILSLDPSNEERPPGGTPPNAFFERGKRADGDYAVSWVKDFGQGRVFYTALGHENAVWNDSKFQAHLRDGIEWALRLAPGETRPK